MLKNLRFSAHHRPIGLFFTSILALVTFFCANDLIAEETFDIEVRFARGDFHQITAQYLHTGVVIVDNAGQDQEAQTLPLKVVAKVNFDQRFTGKGDDLQAIRRYRKTSAGITIDKGATQSELPDESKLVVARIQASSSQRLQMSSISEVLQQKELELIRNPADPLSFVRFFDKQGVSTGDRWKTTPESVADFLAVDRVYENEIEIRLESIKKNIAKVYIVGTAKAEVDDVTTDIEISGVCLIDLKKKLLTAMRTTIREDRMPGRVAPGFKGQTKIDVRIATKTSVPELSDDALARTNAKKIKRRLKWQSDQGDFQVTYDPRWRIIASESEAAVLRYLDEGNLLAQCNIVQLPARPAETPLELAEFKAEIEQIATDEESAKVTHVQELKTRMGLTALRVEVEGVESTVPIKWIYYHVSNKDGRRLTFVFTLEQSVVNRFAKADKMLVNEAVFKTIVRAAQSSESPATPEIGR